MQTQKQPIQQLNQSALYWREVQFSQAEKSTSLLIGATAEYLWDYLGKVESTTNELEGFFDKVILKWQILADKTIYGDDFFGQERYYDVYVGSEEGRKWAKGYLVGLPLTKGIKK